MREARSMALAPGQWEKDRLPVTVSVLREVERSPNLTKCQFHCRPSVRNRG